MPKCLSVNLPINFPSPDKELPFFILSQAAKAPRFPCLLRLAPPPNPVSNNECVFNVRDRRSAVVFHSVFPVRTEKIETQAVLLCFVHG